MRFSSESCWLSLAPLHLIQCESTGNPQTRDMSVTIPGSNSFSQNLTLSNFPEDCSNHLGLLFRIKREEEVVKIYFSSAVNIWQNCFPLGEGLNIQISKLQTMLVCIFCKDKISRLGLGFLCLIFVCFYFLGGWGGRRWKKELFACFFLLVLVTCKWFIYRRDHKIPVAKVQWTLNLLWNQGLQGAHWVKYSYQCTKWII